MLAQVTYIQRFTIADSQDEFMPIFLLQVPLLWQTTQKHLPAGRRAGVGRPAVSNIFDTAGRRRARIGLTHDRPMPRLLELT